ncbi:hypothetical protein EC973_008825 [Apophysomyces ossiformis]|uniref:Uncharacterized protein n=1 Tax=Apophysomyces ossiformis TaxID=679940 RepID=A0A8H7BSI0_9FUNG|nr:hypothetical protein EC973_008825 [Apophysomyces ossiformis]
MYDLTNGILLALERPFWLLNRRTALREDLEQQREALPRRSFGIFLEHRKHAENDKEQVIQTLNEIERTGRQISQSRQMISDELAHFQTIHPKQFQKTIRGFARQQRRIAKLKLSWLLQLQEEIKQVRGDYH